MKLSGVETTYGGATYPTFMVSNYLGQSMGDLQASLESYCKACEAR